MRKISIILLAVFLLTTYAWAGREVYNEDGELDKTYRGVTVKQAGGDKLELTQDGRLKVEGKYAWLYMPDAEKPVKTRILIFYDWGYRLEITVYNPETGERLLCLCPT